MDDSGAAASALGAGWEVAASAPGQWEPRREAAVEGDWRPATVPGTAAAAVGAATAATSTPRTGGSARRFSRRRSPRAAAAIAHARRGRDGQRGVPRRRAASCELGLDVALARARRDRAAAAPRTSWRSSAGRSRPLLRRRRRPAARWRTRVVDDGNLRWYRTMMFGRSPGFAPGPAAGRALAPDPAGGARRAARPQDVRVRAAAATVRTAWCASACALGAPEAVVERSLGEAGSGSCGAPDGRRPRRAAGPGARAAGGPIRTESRRCTRCRSRSMGSSGATGGSASAV